MNVRGLVWSVVLTVLWATGVSAQPQVAVNGVGSATPVSAQAGAVATVSITNGPGHTTDWIALYPIGAADAAYLDWKYLSGSTAPPATGLTTATIQELLPVTPGDYDIRLFASNSYQWLASSGTITISASTASVTINGVASPAGATVTAGAALSVGVTNDPGSATDWLALYPAGAADSAFLDWRYLNNTAVPPASGATSATVAWSAPNVPGLFEIRLFASNGYERLATNPFTVQASTTHLTVNGVAAPTVATVGAGTSALVEVTSGPGNASDWVGLFAIGTTNAQYLAWEYLSGSTSAPTSGVMNATLQFLLPTAPGNYEFRLFANNSPLTSSAMVTVAASTAQIAVNGTAPPGLVTAAAGSVAIASVSGGPANATDWVALYRVGDADTAYLDWRYFSGTTQAFASGSASGVVAFTLPAIAGAYEVRLFAANSGERMATSATLSVLPPTAQIAVNGTHVPDVLTVLGGANLSVTVDGGPGNANDWVALAPTGSSDGTYVAWQYLNGLLTAPIEGMPTGTLNFVAPISAGSYEFRLFTNNTQQRLATSPRVVSGPAVIQIALTSPSEGSTFGPAATVVLEASASTNDGAITRVDFHVGTTLIGSASSSPYAVTWATPASGSYVVTATATTDHGQSATSSAVHVTVTAPACTSATTPTSVTSGPEGLTGTIVVTTTGTCAWTTTSDQAWITLTPSSGVGSGNVGYTIAVNHGPARSAMLTIAGQAVTVAQNAGCTYFVTPSPAHVGSAAHGGYIAVTTTGAGCAPVAPTSNAGWLTIGGTTDDFVQRVLAEGPVGYWAFHETLGATTAPDYTGHGLTGVLVGGAAVTHLGYVDLDGISGRVSVPASPLLTMTSALTAELWLKTTHPGARVIGASNDAWELYVGDTGRLELRLLGQVLRGYLPVTDDVEHFVDATWDGTTASLYVDGVLDGQMAVSGTLSSSADGLLMGAHPTRGDYFAGQLAVVVVFDQALSAAQVADRFLWEDGDQSPTSVVVSYSVETNWATSSRAATITVAPGLPVSVVQAASQCSYVLTPMAITAAAAGQTGWAAVTTNGTGCQTWTPTSSDAWLTLGTPIVDQWDGYMQRVLADDPVAYWTFDDAAGGATTVQDLTGHGLTAALIGGATVPAGHSSMTLDGTGHAIVGASARLNLTHALSIELWFGTTGEQGRFVGANNDAWSLELVTGGYVELHLLGQALRSATAVNDGNQHMVNAAWNGTVAMLYVDGVLDAQMALPGTLPNSTAGLTMGGQTATGDYYTGLLDDVVAFDYALTAAQVLDRYQWDNGEQSDTSGVFAYTVAVNPTGSTRVAALRAADQTTVVTQAGGPPAITSASPATGGAGAQITIAGSTFGFEQGTSVLWLGTKPGTVVTWDDTQIVASVGTGSMSGTVQVRRTDAMSNAVAFTVLTPTITNVTASGDGTQVTITGSGFGAAQGTGQLWLGTVAGAVTSWTNNQIVATVAAGSGIGNVQILQSGVWGNALPFTPAHLTPHVDAITPNTGAAGTVVTIYGSGFGAAPGSGVVMIAGVLASVNSWSDSVVSATVAAGTITGVLKVQQQGVFSNAVTFRVPSGTSTPVNLTPNVMSLAVGDTRSIQGLDPQGAPVPGLTWTSSDPAVVALSTDNPPILTAVAPGNATITAGNASSDVTVYGVSLPLGATIWSHPSNGFSLVGTYIAVPNYDAVADVFAVSQNDVGVQTVQAITSDGTVAWTAPSPGGTYLPDFQGGLVIAGYRSISRLAPLTGALTMTYTPTNAGALSYGLDSPAIHTDGTIFTTDYACTHCGDFSDGTDGAWVIGLDPATGATKFRVPLENSMDTIHIPSTGVCAVDRGGLHDEYFSYINTPIKIAGDGFAYIGYQQYVYEERDRRASASVHPYPDDAYQWFDRFYLDIGHDWDAALNDLAALGAALGEPFLSTDPIYQAVQAHDSYAAATIMQARAGDTYKRPCNSDSTFTVRFHLMRIGADGSHADVVVKEWRSNQSVVFDPSDVAPFYHITETETGPDPRVSDAKIITNADQGVVYSWQIREECYGDYDTAVRSRRHVGPCGTETEMENHLTTASGGAITSDVVWHPGASEGYPVEPILQLENGSFVANVSRDQGDALVVFSGSGVVSLVLPGYQPSMVTPGGFVAGGPSGVQYMFSNDGSSQAALNIPTYSWGQHAYAVGQSSVVQLAGPVTGWGFSFAAMREGNPSNNGTSVGVLAQVAGRAGFTLPSWGGACVSQPGAPRVKVPLGGAALSQYVNLKQQLLASGRLAATSACSVFFDADDNRRTYVQPLPDGDTALAKGVQRQVPYDGPMSTISLFDAGAYDRSFLVNNPTFETYFRNTMMCSMFVGAWYATTAYSQGTAPSFNTPVTDVFFNTSPGVLASMTQGTIIHEALHNLTGYSDWLDPAYRGATRPFDLKDFMSMYIFTNQDPAETVSGIPGDHSSIDVTSKLRLHGCAPPQ